MSVRLFLRRIYIVTQAFATLFLATALQAASAAEDLFVDYALSEDGNTVVRVTPITSISSESFDASLITSAYAGWTVTKAGAAPVSGIYMGSYEAAWSSENTGGGRIVALYTQSNDVPAGNSLQWIQVFTVNVPYDGTHPTSSGLDGLEGSLPKAPFYFDYDLQGDREVAKPTSNSVFFSDFSRLNSSRLQTTNPIIWNAQLYQVEYDGNNNVIVRDGISWGWTMKPATVGKSTGRFIASTPACPPARCTGIDSSSVSWVTGVFVRKYGSDMIFEDVRKSLSYAGTEFAPPVDESFTLGSLSFANWGVPEGHELAYSFDNVVTSFEFEIVMSFDNVSELDFTYHVEMNVIGNSISYTLDGITYTFTVKEGTSASTDVIGKLVPKLDAYIVETVNGVDTVGWKIVGYDLLLLGFANPTAGGYVTSSIPEASSWLMFLFGLAVIGLVKGNRRTILSVA